jgi:hypothetical protein
MSDWTEQDCIEAAKKDPEGYGRQVFDLSNKRIQLSNELRLCRGWLRIDDPKAKASGDILLHLYTGQDGDGTISWMTVIGRWEGQWNGSGLKNMGPRYWSPIPETPEHLRKSVNT